MPERVFIRITHENVGSHKRIAVTHPVIESVVEARRHETDPWEEIEVTNISQAIKGTKIETEPGGLVRLWLEVIAFDVAVEGGEEPHITRSPADPDLWPGETQ